MFEISSQRVKYSGCDEAEKLSKGSANVPPGPWKSVAQRYIDGDLAEIHVHIRVGGTVLSEYCAVFERAEHPEGEAIDGFDSYVLRSHARHDGHEQSEMTMLVDIRELVQYPERMRGRVLPVSVRLQALDQCSRSSGNATEPSLTSDGIFELFSGRCDGKHQVGLDSRHEMPPGVMPSEITNEVVERGTQVLDHVSEQQREPDGGLAFRDDYELLRVCLHVYFLRDSIRLAFEPPLNRLVKSLCVFACPPELPRKDRVSHAR